MRVIAGKYRSRSLQSLPENDTRPTYDRLKETLFNVLSAAGKLDGAVFLDLFAGTGSIGIEALSRGAAQVYFIESGRKAAQVIRANLESLGITNGVEVLERSAAEGVRQLAASHLHADVIFLDPPYAMQGAYEKVFRVIAQTGILNDSGVVVAEHHKRFDPGSREGNLSRYRTLSQGDSALSFYRMNLMKPERPAS